MYLTNQWEFSVLSDHYQPKTRKKTGKTKKKYVNCTSKHGSNTKTAITRLEG